MSKEQKELLYKIANAHIEEFYHRMGDSWSGTDYRFSKTIEKKIDTLESEYRKEYGDLPKWEYIDDILKDQAALKQELEIGRGE